MPSFAALSTRPREFSGTFRIQDASQRDEHAKSGQNLTHPTPNCENARVSRRNRHPSSDLTTTLASGRQAWFEREGDRWQLHIDGTPQSEIDLFDPTRLEFGYIRHMGHALDLAFAAKRAITAVHLGAGAMTLPRYVEATRPGSRQQVIEIDRELIDFVRRVAPLPAHASIRVRYGDAREQLARLPEGLRGTVDALIVDVFAGDHTPPHLTSAEFFDEVASRLSPAGIVLANVADGAGLNFARREVATIREAVGPVTLIAEPAVLKGRRFGNIVVAAGREAREWDGLARRVGNGFPPGAVVTDSEAVAWMRGATPFSDADAVGSPSPDASVFIR